MERTYSIDELRGRFVGRPANNKQRLRCPNVHAHKNGDFHASAVLYLDTGVLYCAVCGRLGTIGGGWRTTVSKALPVQATTASQAKHSVELQCIYEALPDGTAVAAQRGLSYATAQAFGLRQGDGNWIPSNSLVIPYFDDTCSVRGLKYRLINSSNGVRYRCVPGTRLELVGALMLQRRDTLVVVEGELNAMSVWQACRQYCDVLGLPGQTLSTHLFERLKDTAVRYKRVIVWMDERERAFAIASQLSKVTVTLALATTLNECKYDANEILLRYGENVLIDYIATIIYGE